MGLMGLTPLLVYKFGRLQVRVLPSALLDDGVVAKIRLVVPSFSRRKMVTILVTVRTHTNMYHPAKRLINAPHNAASHTIAQSLSDSKNPVRATSCGFESHLRHNVNLLQMWKFY